MTKVTEAESYLILTPNQPLAQQLRRMRLESLGVARATSGNIQVLNAWLAESLSKQAALPLATEAQLLLLWQMALERVQAKFPDLTPRTLAPQALSAWQNLKRYQISVDELRTAEIGQLVRFSDSAREFEALLKARNLSTIELEIAQGLEVTPTSSEQNASVCLYAFVEPVPPLFQHWLEHCFERVEVADYIGTASQSFLFAAESQHEELEAAGGWAAGVLSRDPHARVGIAHTNLGQELNRATRIVKNQLPENLRFSASLKPPLSNTGVIASALDLLALNRKQLDIAQARRIAQSPFWSDFHSEYATRACWEADMCGLQSRQVRSDQIRELLDKQASEHSQLLLQKLLKFSEAARRKSASLSPLEWADLFHDQLGILGWPEPHQETETQLLTTAWYDALREFAHLGSVATNIDLNQALQLLQRCCDKRRTDAGASHVGVRLIDTIEGAADYTHLWFTGMSAEQWPGAVDPNPLLPASLQRKHGMPRSNAEQATALAKQLIDRIGTTAQETVFSYARSVDELEQNPSGLLPELPTLELDNHLAQEKDEAPSTRFEWLNTEFAPPLADPEKQVPGGASLLRAMAASPFDAFVQWRLGAEPLAEPKTGLDAAERGTLVHEVLDSIWKKLESSETLKAKQQTDLEALCAAKAKRELQRWQGKHRWLSLAHQELEISRLASLALSWLAVEIERPPFVIKESEARLDAQLGELRFHLRLDRLDQLADGSRLLIDYKTGQGLTTKSWLDLPPAEPQLPLYAISLADAPDAICFAQIRPDQMRFIGLGNRADQSGFSEVEQWPELLALWRDSLTELADQYTQGLARADETDAEFGRADPLAPLHRMSEYEAIEERRRQDD